MAYHHVAVAVTDLAETHRFYTEVMGFELVKAQAAPTDAPGGWAKHVFYATGELVEGEPPELIAFWELHDDRMASFDPAISLDHGHDVVEIDHGFCVSIYTLDPSRILVEFCTDTAPYTDADRQHAMTLIDTAEPELVAAPSPVFHEAPK
jgi:catechol 2,3-dioxygenase-like lactoylglutathione lyase family enzyme